jgi:hypothetical protein
MAGEAAGNPVTIVTAVWSFAGLVDVSLARAYAFE